MAKKKLKKILIIEDETMLQEALVENLTDEGYEVEGFADAESAFKSINLKKPDIILTDLVLPNIDGFEIIKLLHERIDTNDIPIIVLSNLGEPEDVERAKALGATEYLVKAELSLGEVAERVEKIIG